MAFISRPALPQQPIGQTGGFGGQPIRNPGSGGVGFGGPISSLPVRGSFDKLKGKKKIKKSGLYKLKRGETVEGKKLNELM